MRLGRAIAASGRSVHLALHGHEVAVLHDLPPGGAEDWLANDPEALTRVAERAARAERAALEDFRLLAPIRRPPKFLGIGGNYASHLREVEHLGIVAPKAQTWFNKQITCVAGPYDDLVIPRISDQVDYEGELAVVIGRRCRNVPAHRAREVIAGFMACNDVSVRDVQLRATTQMLGKSFDTHGPIGPWLVTPDEVEDPQDLEIRTWVNGELRQAANTSEMIYPIAEQIAELSSIFTLEPGDILATGSPAGVGAAMRPARYIKAGDLVCVDVAGVGRIENRFIPDPVGVLIA